MKFSTRIAGIPCICRVLDYSPEKPAYTFGEFGEAIPADPEEFDFELLDRKGYKAQWLENKITDDDEIRLRDEFLHHIKQMNYPMAA